MKEIRRETLGLSDMSKITRDKLREFNISETVVNSVIRAYIESKREALLNGKFVQEEGIATEGIETRGVSKGFTDKGFTVKIKASIDWKFRQEAMDLMEKDEELQDIMNFDPDKYKERM